MYTDILDSHTVNHQVEWLDGCTPKDKRLRTQMNVKFNDTSSADEEK
jgi:hypothetical protein